MDTTQYVERMLETENLTDELQDSAANWLLNWGAGRLDRVLKDVEGEEAAGQKVNALMAVMRKINRMVGARQDKDPAVLASDFKMLAALASDLYECDPDVNAAECLSAAVHLRGLAEEQYAVEFSARWSLLSVGKL
jgi:hypothetical protein